MTTSPTYFVDYTSRWAVYVCVPVYIDMVEVGRSNLAGPTKHKEARFKRAFLCLKVYPTLELAEPVDKRDHRSVWSTAATRRRPQGPIARGNGD